jgi:hypothetical protein
VESVETMISISDIAAAIRELTPAQRSELMLQLAEMIRTEAQPLPAPRTFDALQLERWVEEDEQAMREHNGAKECHPECTHEGSSGVGQVLVFLGCISTSSQDASRVRSA